MNLRYTYILVLVALLNSCASITTPTGGPKDVKPPLLVQSIPANNSTDFKGTTVTLLFSEWVKLDNPKEEIIISPSPGKNVDIKVKGNRVTITPEKKWKDSTTYSILPRAGIKDITEGNSTDSLKLAFSTGPEIDSLTLNGTIKDLLKGIPGEKITVGIFSQDTFDIFSDTSSYFTKTDKRGKFRLDNIKAGTYRIYAFDDKNKNLKVESKTERYGFIAKNLELNQPLDSITIGLIMLDSRPLKITSIRNIGTITRLRFNKYITDYAIKPDTNLTHSFGDNQTEIVFYNPVSTTDSLQLHMTATDSLFNTLDTTFYIKKTTVKPIKEDFKITITDPMVDSETGKFTTLIKYTKPLANINFDSVFIAVDTVSQIAIQKQDVSLDLIHKEIRIVKDFDRKLFKAEKDPVFIFNTRRGFLYSVDNDTSRNQNARVEIIWPENTGILFYQVETKEKYYIIQLLDRSYKIKQAFRNENHGTFKNVNPGEYFLRIIVDSNNNGKWDPGNVTQRIEPEKSVFYVNPGGKQIIPVRANWELGPLILKF